MIRFLLLFITIALITGCYCKRSDEVTIPEEKTSISPEKMSEILTDFHLLQSAMKQKQSKKEDFMFENRYYHYLIFKKHNVTQEEFENSLEYYKYRIDELNNIYEDVIINLSVLESEIKSKK
jgi:hypothetical protein